MNKTCDIPDIILSHNIIDYVCMTKYLGVILCSHMKTSVDVFRQTSKFYAQANTLSRNFRYCSDKVKLKLFVHFAPICIVPHYGLTIHNLIKKKKTCYYGALRRLLP